MITVVATTGEHKSSSPFEALKEMSTTAPAPSSASADQATDTAEETTREPARPARKENWVVFNHFDTDSLLCAWVLCRRKRFKPVLLEPGEDKCSEEDAANFNIQYVDMGGGDCDHHGKGLVYTSSFELVLRKYELIDDPGMQVLLELSKKADNAVEIPWDSLHHVVMGTLYDPYFRPDNNLDYSKILDFAFVTFDICYRQARYRDKTLREYLSTVKEETLPNGLRMVLLRGGAKYRGVAFERGVDVVICVEWVNKNDAKEGILVQLMVNRKSRLDLADLVAHLRYAEMANRKIEAKFSKLDMVGLHPNVPGWFALDPQPDPLDPEPDPEKRERLIKLVVNGTRNHPGTKESRTVMTPGHIQGIVRSKLRTLPTVAK